MAEQLPDRTQIATRIVGQVRRSLDADRPLLILLLYNHEGEKVTFLETLNTTSIAGCIVLNITSIGTGAGIPAGEAARMRAAFDGTLIYGGGVATREDLATLAEAGFDGAIIATAVHTGAVPLEWIREGTVC